MPKSYQEPIHGAIRMRIEPDQEEYDDTYIDTWTDVPLEERQEKKAKLQLILNEIAKIEKIAPDIKEIEAEVNHIVEHYTDADRERATIYAETVLTNEKVYGFLEEAK